MPIMLTTAKFIHDHVIGEEVLNDGDDTIVRSFTPAAWSMLAGLTPTERTQGWAHADTMPLDPATTVIRFSPATMASHLDGIPIGPRTHTGDPHPPPGTVDARLRALETLWALEILRLDTEPDRDAAIAAAALDFQTWLPTVAAAHL